MHLMVLEVKKYRWASSKRRDRAYKVKWVEREIKEAKDWLRKVESEVAYKRNRCGKWHLKEVGNSLQKKERRRIKTHGYKRGKSLLISNSFMNFARVGCNIKWKLV